MARKLMTVFTLILLASFTGCGSSSHTAIEPAGTAGKHDGWWCVEHGIPEGVCAQCNTKVAAACKAKGDWCSEHDRPESQCFPCHPELEQEFAAQFEAKYGAKPPKPTAEAAGHNHDHSHDGHDHDHAHDHDASGKK